MNQQIARILTEMTADFYAANAESFSATRQSAWPGWERVAAALGEPSSPLRVADVACGNGRFLSFLGEKFPEAAIAYCGWDGNEQLLAEAAALGAKVQRRDVLDALFAAESAAQPGEEKAVPGCGTLPLPDERSAPLPGNEGENHFDLVVCFGFFHHVPGEERRARLLEALLQLVRPGGLVAVSLWRFADHEPLRQKAERSTTQALLAREELTGTLEPGDYLLGWGEACGSFRYCHSFSEKEIDRLVQTVDGNAQLLDRFQADGRTNKMNEYLVFSRLPLSS